MTKIQLFTRSLLPLLVMASVGLASPTALSQADRRADNGNLEQPDLPQAYRNLSSQNLEGTYVTVYFKNSLIKPAHDTDKRWLDLKSDLENAATAAYPFDIRLSPDSHNIYALVCDSGGSADPSCKLYDGVPSQHAKPKFSAPGLAFIVPGDGCIYVAGHTDNMYDTRLKFCEAAGELKEVSQPFHYVGIKSEALHDLDVYSDRALKQKNGVVRTSAFVEILVDDHGVYLIRDEFGITGWLKVDGLKGCMGTEEGDLAELCYAGD
jgi:hypothetical protein